MGCRVHERGHDRDRAARFVDDLGKSSAQNPAGAAQVREFHRQLFADASGPLLQEIKSITGMEVRNTTAEIEPKTGSVVQIFTTNTVAEEFLLASSGSAGTWE